MSCQWRPTRFMKQSGFLILLVLVTSLHWCAGRSASSLPLAGIFGLSDNKEKEKKQKQQNEQRVPPHSNQQPPPNMYGSPPQGGRGYPPPPQGGRGPPPQGRQGGPPPQQQRRPPFMPPQRGNIPPQHDPRRSPRQQSQQQQPPRSQLQPSQPQRPPPPPPMPGRDATTTSSSSPPPSSTQAISEEDAEAKVSLEAIEKELAALKNETEALLIATQEENIEEVTDKEGADSEKPVEPDEAGASPNLQSQSPWQNKQSQNQQAEQLPPPPQVWLGQPPPGNFQNGGWGMQAQQPQPPPEYQQGWDQQPYDGGMYGYQNELDMSLAREHDLLMQLQNITDMADSMQQREDLHIRQLDVLTERVMDVEAQAAHDRNLAIEYESNCTALGMTIATLSDELEDWKKRCTELSELRDQDEERIAEFKKLIEEKSAEAEELAVAIENVRLVERVKKGSSGGRRTQRKGLFGWIFSLFFGSDYSETEEMTREDAYELGKSTLLRALQSERSSVMELEASVASLQQNNSAISEMVESRDMLIDELNNRIAVFEEDKVVLKAALKQLQKEIQEEAPKTQKLMDTLDGSKQEVKRLNAEINSIIKTHQAELNSLQKTIFTKQKAINETESNLTAIGTYVDKLEERLTSFAITRRDMEEREKKCKQIEESALKAEEEVKVLESKVEEYTKQQEDLKKLLEEMALERANLQKANRKLVTDQEFRIGEEERLKAAEAALDLDVKALTKGLAEAREEVDALKISLEASQSSNFDLQEQLSRIEVLESELNTSQSENTKIKDDYLQSSEMLQSELEKAKAELDRLQAEISARDEEEKQRIERQRLEKEERELRERLENKQKSSDGESSPTEQTGPTQPQVPPGARPPNPPRDVPLRSIRKKLSKLTGLHGLVTPSSKMEQSKLRQMQQQKVPRIPQNVPRPRSLQDRRQIPPNGASKRPGPPLFRQNQPEMEKIEEETTPLDDAETGSSEPSQLLADLSDSEEEPTMTMDGEIDDEKSLPPPPLPPKQPFQRQQHPYGATHGVEQQSQYQYPPGPQQPPQ